MNRLERAAVVLPVSLALAASICSCAAPPRRLTRRVVEDPSTLPSRLASVVIKTGVTARSLDGAYYPHLQVLEVRYGITDRLELLNGIALRYAFLDDAAGASGTARGPLGVDVLAGLTPAYSVRGELIAAPILGLSLRKHLGTRVSLSVSAEQFTDVRDRWFPWTTFSLWGSGYWQLTEAVAVGLTLQRRAWTWGFAPWGPWYERHQGALLGAVIRPRRWLGFGLSAGLHTDRRRYSIRLTPETRVAEVRELLAARGGPFTSLNLGVGVSF